jgi:hypothetical protein
LDPLYPKKQELYELPTADEELWITEAFVRLHLTEGTPWVFRKYPDFYEDMRAWLSNRLEVCPKDIILLNSARLGFSHTHKGIFGHDYRCSDFDFAVVSNPLFQKFKNSFYQWKNDYEKGKTMPKNQNEKENWDDIKKLGIKNICNGYYDSTKLPNRHEYPEVRKVNNTMWGLIEKLKVTPGAPVPSRASVRIYDSWKSLINRVSFNLLYTMRANKNL